MKRIYYFVFIAALLFASRADSKTWTIEFGGVGSSQLYTYSPQVLNVNVGDTIIWQGSFPDHPLTLLSAPSGADKFSSVTKGNDGDDKYLYVVKVAGEGSNGYAYRCEFHYATHQMFGGFTAAAAGVEVKNPQLNSMSQNYPNPVDLNHTRETMIHLMLKKVTHVKLQIFDMQGKLVKTQLDGQLGEGMQMITVDVSNLASGTYNYVLTQEDGTERRAMIVVK